MKQPRLYQKEEVRRSKNARQAIENLKLFQSLFAGFYLLILLEYLIAGWFYDVISPGDFALVPIIAFSLLGMVWWFSSQIPIIFRDIGCIKAGLRLFFDTAEGRKIYKETPLRLHHTDNGKEFTDRLFGLRKREATGKHEFDRLCKSLI